MITLQQLRAALGGEISGNQVLCPGPGHPTRDRSLAVRPTSDGGFIVHTFSAADDWKTCRDYVRWKLGLPAWRPGDEQDRRMPRRHLRAFDQAVVDQEAEERRPYTEDEKARSALAVRIWDGGSDPRGTLAERYLNERRKLDLPPHLAVTMLRFHARCPWRDENTGTTIFVPALIAAFRSIDDDKITAIHRIALNPDGSKIGRRMLGVVHRTAVMLDPPGDVLTIGEGIETCMAARELGFAPAWALGSVGRISKFPLIDGVKTLKILGEAGTASTAAVDFCVPRWRAAGRQVQTIMPDHPFSDLNDELMKRREIA
jgi:putative DNA primase/helicase